MRRVPMRVLHAGLRADGEPAPRSASGPGRGRDQALPVRKSLPLRRLCGNHRSRETCRAQAARRRRLKTSNNARGGVIMQSISIADHTPWYGTLTRAQWKTLAAANLGWMFDGYETFALILTVGVALRQLLDPSLFPQIPAYAGTVIAVTLLGWGVGGIIGGVLADY